MIFLYSTCCLIFAFIIHVVWWRIKLPKHTTTSLVMLFLVILILTSICFFEFQHPKAITLPQLIQYVMLYSSGALVYIILYSAIEQQSPTLAIVSYLADFGNIGCNTQAISKKLDLTNEYNKRIKSTLQSGWLTITTEKLFLTPRGKRVAKLFYSASLLFGLSTGG